MKRNLKAAVVSAGVGAMAIAMTGCGQVAIDNSLVGLRYESGATQGAKFKQCLAPGKSIQTNDRVYPYPNTQREVLLSNTAKGADDGSVVFQDASGITMTATVTVSLFVNTSCKPVTVNGKRYPGGTLQVFHELFGKTRHAYFNLSGSYTNFGDQDKGWLYVLRLKVGQPTTTLFRKYGSAYNAADLWLKQSVDDELGKKVQDDLEQAVNDVMQTDLDFFKDFHVQVTDIKPAKSFQQIFTDRQEAQQKAETAELNKTAQVAQAQAEQAALRIKIDTYGSVDNYLRSLVIANNQNPYQSPLAGLQASR